MPPGVAVVSRGLILSLYYLSGLRQIFGSPSSFPLEDGHPLESGDKPGLAPYLRRYDGPSLVDSVGKWHQLELEPVLPEPIAGWLLKCDPSLLQYRESARVFDNHPKWADVLPL